MKRKSLLFLLLFALIAPWAANAQSVTIGSGTSTSNYLPSYSYYNYSISQQIYTADEIAASGNITSIAFYNGGTVKARKYDIYMAHTTKTAFDGTSDWIALTDADIVYHGTATVSMTANAWTTFTLDTPFAYNGTSNLVICVIDRTGNYSSSPHMACRTYSTTEYQALYCYNDNYDALSPNGTNDGTALSYTLGRPLLKNQIVLGGIQQANPTPTDLTCTGTTSTTATLSWTENGSATAWQICLNGDEDNPIPANSNPFTLNGLTEATTYTVKVRTTAPSQWSSTISFTTKQTALAVGNGWSDNFEGSNNWLMFNGGNNAWVIGTAVNNGGDKAMYVSNDGGTTNAYTVSGINMVYATKLMTFETGQYIFEYDWQAYGESSYDYIRAWLAPATATFTVNQLPNGSTSMYSYTNTTPEGWISLDGGGKLNLVSTWQEGQTAIVDVTAGDYYVVFMWGNDVSGGTQPPAAIDNFEITKVACAIPTAFAVADVTNHTATFSWTSDADAWQLCINGDEANPIPVTTNPYTLTGLDAETAYTAKLRANCGAEDGVSFWTDEVRFTTEIACPAPTALTVVPVDPNSVNVSWEGSANGYEMEYANVAGGVSGLNTYGFEEDLEGWTNLIVNDEGGQWLHSNDNPGGYIDPTATDNPYYPDLAHGGTGFAMCYSYIDYDGPYDTDAYLVSPNAYQINEGASLNFWYDMANDSYPEYFEVCVATVANPTADDFTAIWSWSEAKATLDPSRKVPMGRSNMRHINRTRYDNWREVTVDLSDYVGQTIWIAFHDVNYDMYELWIDDVTIDAGTSSEITWIPVGAVTSPYTLEGLDEGTQYLLRLRAVCGGIDGESVWVNTNFTTPTFCDAPFALNVPFETLMPTTATLKWTGYQDGFEIRYRIPQVALFEEGFENGIPSTWTTIDNDTTSLNDWFALSDIMDIYSYYTSIPEWAHSGSNAALSSSYANGVGAFATDQYLVTPQLTLNGTLKFYAKSTYSDPDTYEVLLSTTGTNIEDFTITLQAMGPATYNSFDEVSIDLSEYAGQQGYIAIHHVAADKYFLVIDDFGLYEIAGDDDWIPVSTDAQFVDIEDLDPETEYEWQVRGEHRGCTNGEEEGYTPWSTMGTFTTPGLCDPFARITIDTVTATSITLSWLGYQESYNVRYRTPADADEVFYDDFSEYEDIDGDDYITLADTDWTGSNLNDDEEQPSDIYTLNFTDGTSMTVFGFAGNGTDQYLISPEFEVENAGILEFYYLAYQASTQTFQVGFSSTDNALTSFTWSEAFTNGTEDYTDYYQIEVPAGTKYFAIKSSGESGLLLLSEFYVGDNYVPASEWIVFEGVTDNPYTITGLTPGTIYQVGIQGNCTETTTTDWYGGYITTLEQTTVTQTLELVEGWNWVSLYVEFEDAEEAMLAFQEALGEHGIKISAVEDFVTYSEEEGWGATGELEEMTNDQMYMVKVDEDIVVTLEGMPSDPADYTITIYPGWTWIGFPSAEAIAVEDAFADFEAEEGDKIQGVEDYTKFGDDEWGAAGELEEMTPGMGYMYLYHGEDEIDLVYSTGAKRTANTIILTPQNQKRIGDRKSVDFNKSVVKIEKK